MLAAFHAVVGGGGNLGIAISYLEHQLRREKVYNMPEPLTLMKYCITLISISLITYILAVQLPLLKEQLERRGRNTLQP